MSQSGLRIPKAAAIAGIAALLVGCLPASDASPSPTGSAASPVATTPNETPTPSASPPVPSATGLAPIPRFDPAVARNYASLNFSVPEGTLVVGRVTATDGQTTLSLTALYPFDEGSKQLAELAVPTDLRLMPKPLDERRGGGSIGSGGYLALAGYGADDAVEVWIYDLHAPQLPPQGPFLADHYAWSPRGLISFWRNAAEDEITVFDPTDGSSWQIRPELDRGVGYLWAEDGSGWLSMDIRNEQAWRMGVSSALDGAFTPSAPPLRPYVNGSGASAAFSSAGEELATIGVDEFGPAVIKTGPAGTLNSIRDGTTWFDGRTDDEWPIWVDWDTDGMGLLAVFEKEGQLTLGRFDVPGERQVLGVLDLGPTDPATNVIAVHQTPGAPRPDVLLDFANRGTVVSSGGGAEEAQVISSPNDETIVLGWTLNQHGGSGSEEPKQTPPPTSLTFASHPPHWGRWRVGPGVVYGFEVQKCGDYESGWTGAWLELENGTLLPPRSRYTSPFKGNATVPGWLSDDTQWMRPPEQIEGCYQGWVVFVTADPSPPSALIGEGVELGASPADLPQPLSEAASRPTSPPTISVVDPGRPYPIATYRPWIEMSWRSDLTFDDVQPIVVAASRQIETITGAPYWDSVVTFASNVISHMYVGGQLQDSAGYDQWPFAFSADGSDLELRTSEFDYSYRPSFQSIPNDVVGRAKVVAAGDPAAVDAIHRYDDNFAFASWDPNRHNVISLSYERHGAYGPLYVSIDVNVVTGSVVKIHEWEGPS